jgi:hypothetical protein
MPSALAGIFDIVMHTANTTSVLNTVMHTANTTRVLNIVMHTANTTSVLHSYIINGTEAEKTSTTV